jgi:hypothetical protein
MPGATPAASCINLPLVICTVDILYKDRLPFALPSPVPECGRPSEGRDDLSRSFLLRLFPDRHRIRFGNSGYTLS